MKTIFILIAITLSYSGVSQTNDSLELKKRLQNYMALTVKKDFDKVMDYVHPSLFKMATRDQLKEALESAYSTEEIEINFDSMYVSAISPEFKLGQTGYRRVDYYMMMSMRFNDKETATDTSLVNILIPALQADFPGQSVTYDKAKSLYIIKGFDLLIAIRDAGKEWMFLGVEKDNAMLMTLFPKEVIAKFSLQ